MIQLERERRYFLQQSGELSHKANLPSDPNITNNGVARKVTYPSSLHTNPLSM